MVSLLRKASLVQREAKSLIFDGGIDPIMTILVRNANGNSQPSTTRTNQNSVGTATVWRGVPPLSMRAQCRYIRYL